MITYSCDRCGIEIAGHGTVSINVMNSFSNTQTALLHFCPACRDGFVVIVEKYIPKCLTKDLYVNA